MTSRERSSGSSICLLSFCAEEVRDILEQAGASADPADPRLGPLLAQAALVQWASEAIPANGDEDESGLSDWYDWPESRQRLCPIADINIRGHRIGLAAVVRYPDARAPAEHNLPLVLVKELGLAVDYVCPAYVQLADGGGAEVLLEGMVAFSQLMEHARDDDIACVVTVRRTWLTGMDQIRGTLAEPAPARALAAEVRPAAEPAPKRIPPDRLRRQLRRLAVPGFTLAAAAGLMLAVFVGVVQWLLPGPRVEPPAGPPFQGSLAQWRLLADGQRGPSQTTPVLLSRQKYTLAVRAASDRRAGWVYQVDAAGAFLLGELRRGPDGVFSFEYQGQLDDRAGAEFFVAVLADYAWPALKPDRGVAAKWLDAEQLGQLQELAARQDDSGVERQLQEAISRSGPPGVKADVVSYRFEHRAP